MQQWWNDVLDWFSTEQGTGVLFGAIIPFVAIVVAGVVAALIGRGTVRRMLTLNDRENRIAAVSTMIGAARRAAVWNTLTEQERDHAAHVAAEADVRIRLMSTPGAGLAADWAAHELTEMRANSATFSFQAEQSLIDFRERLVAWQSKPSRAKKLFKNDLEAWAYDDAQKPSDLVSKQQAWAAAQVQTETGPITTSVPLTSPASSASPASASTAPMSTAPMSAGAASTGAVATSRAPIVAEPARSFTTATPSSGTDFDGDDDEPQESVSSYSPPVGAGTVTKRINPQPTDDDRH